MADLVARGFNCHFATRNCKPLMSALSHKQTLERVRAMSPLPQKKRTLAKVITMSALCQ